MGVRRRATGDDAGAVGGAERADDQTLEPLVIRSVGRWRLRNWRLRAKLVVVLLVPLLTAVSLGGLRVMGQWQVAQVYDRISQEVRLGGAASDVVDNLQLEREQVVLYTASKKAAGAGPGSPQTKQVDASVAAFKQQAASSSDIDPSMRAAVDAAITSLGNLNALRTSNDGTPHPETAVFNGYNQIVAALRQASRVAQVSTADPRIYQVGQGLDALRDGEEQYTQGDVALMVAAQEGSFPPGMRDALQGAQAQFGAAVNSFNNVASAADRQMLTTTFAGADVDERARLLQLAGIRADAQQSLGFTAADIARAGDGAAALLHNAEGNQYQELRSITASASSDAMRQALWEGSIIAFALMLTLSLAGIVAESLVASLRRLRAGAIDVARTRLPESVQRILADDDPISASERSVEPVPVFTIDEIGEVARAFDLVHGQAVRLAAEQAVLRDNVNTILVNLSRRSQTLVERQLALIDQLERDEQDPDQLANLFELDHLATRMRRNSESLLVLSGSGLATRMSQPVRIGELVGAAVSEVEQYTRIDLGSPPDVSVLGRAVNDLIHLIAELLDNATAYSEPSTKVFVRIASTKARELAIQVTDRGVGMTEQDMRRHNEQLANPPDIDVAVTRRMGLYVVARLAQRHGIRVKLRANEDIDGGTVALVMIPASLVYWPGDESVRSTQTEGVPSSHSDTKVSFPSLPVPAASADAGAGIAGAFGRGFPRGRPVVEAHPVEDGQADSFEPATTFWRTDFEPARESPGPATALPATADESSTDAEDSGVDLWRAYTSVDAPEAAAPPRPTHQRNGWPFAATTPDSNTPTAPGPGDAGQPGHDRPVGGPELDAPTERLPIYEAVLSQWFRAEARSAGDPAPPVAPMVAQDQPPEAGNEGGTHRFGSLPTRVPGRAGDVAGVSWADGSDPEPEVSPAPSHQAVAAVEPTWHTPADEGWQAAEALLAKVSDFTNAGLPKRVPKAHLVPGSAASPPPAPQPVEPAPLPPRSADAVRGRMSSFQKGVHRGRNTLMEAYSGGVSDSLQGRPHEEQE